MIPTSYQPVEDATGGLMRPTLTKAQAHTLEAHFQQNHKPNSTVKRLLARDTGLSLPRVANWFQNRRAKAKQEKKEAEHGVAVTDASNKVDHAAKEAAWTSLRRAVDATKSAQLTSTRYELNPQEKHREGFAFENFTARRQYHPEPLAKQQTHSTANQTPSLDYSRPLPPPDSPQYSTFPDYMPPISAGPLTNSNWLDGPLTSSEMPNFPPVTFTGMVGFGQAFPNQPQLAAPNDQDTQRLRAQNPRLQNMADDQVRQAIINRQGHQLHEAMRQQTAQRGMQPGQMPPQQQPQKQQLQQPPKPQSQQPTRPPSQTNQSKAPQTPADKGVKRASESGKPDGPAPTAKPAMQPQRMPNMTKEQYDALPPAKKAQLVDRQMVQRLVASSKQVQTAMPKLQPVKLDSGARQRMIAKLTEDGTKNMVNRFDQLLLAFYKQNKDDVEMRSLIFSKLQLFSQYEQPSISTKTWVPVQQFTITPERVEDILKDLRTRFSTMTAGIAQQQQRQQQPAQLTPENLSRLQEQEDRKKSIKGGKDVPPAPTATQPPFQFGDNRGHGAPKYAGTGLKQEDLKLDPKRRKKNPPGGQTPASLSATPPAASPQVTKSQPPAQSQVFRCPDPNCERYKQGFSSQPELNQHTNSVHRIDTEPVTDPLAFLDASLRDAFNLDENFKQIKKPAPMAPPMEKTASKGSIANLKVESKPATPAAMVKMPSQSGRPHSAQLNKDDMGLKAQADDWDHTKITLEELNNIFGDMDWEEAVPAAALELQDKFIQQYQQSEEWQKLIRTPGGSLTDTTTDKSTSPPNAANKELGIKTEEVGKKNDLFVDLEIDGLDLTGLEDLDADSAPNADITMADGDSDSPFELLDKPAITAEQQFLLDNGIDYTRPETLNAEQKRLMEFIVEPFAVGTEPAFDDAPWEDIDWEAEERQRQEDIRLGTPGAWNGQGFNRFP